MRLRGSFVFVFLFASSALFAQTLRIATFSMARLEDSPKRNYAVLAQIVRRFDLVGCIDVGAPEGLARIMKYLGNEWTSFVSERPNGNGSLKEYYGFIWKSGKIRFAHSLGYFKDSNNLFATKPYGAEFLTSNGDFTLILVHLSENVAPEARHLGEVYEYFLGLVAAGNVILGGDFNHVSSDQLDGFREAENLTDAMDFDTRTVLGLHGPALSSDHIFVNLFTRGSLREAGAYDYVPELGAGDYSKCRDTISDHLPVYIELRL